MSSKGTKSAPEGLVIDHIGCGGGRRRRDGEGGVPPRPDDGDHRAGRALPNRVARRARTLHHHTRVANVCQQVAHL